jgi:mono/diheme cytochrome c family protein
VSIGAPLPVDLALSPVNNNVLLASATIAHPLQAGLGSRAQLLSRSTLQLDAAPSLGVGFVTSELGSVNPPGTQLVAVAFTGETPILQYREPSSLIIGDRAVPLPGDTTKDTGNMLFHLQTGSALACASCHPEGQDDGHVWHFSGFGPRRTQSLRGGLLGTEPFHWDGTEQDFAALTADVMQGRMAGPPLSAEQTTALAKYIDALPALPAPAPDATNALVARGQKLFDDAKVGCATCHSGARLSNDQTVFVGGDTPLQVPSLVGVWARAPYLHDGCAQTLLDRFTTCDTGQHGNLQGLSGDDLDALVAYLDSL